MAIALVAELIGEGLIEALDHSRSAVARKVKMALEWLREKAEPPDGVELRASDGSVYTGLAIIEHNDVVLMWAFRQPATIVERPAPPTPPPAQRPLAIHPESPFWDGEHPYGR